MFSCKRFTALLVCQYFAQIPKLKEPFSSKSTFHQSVMMSSMKLSYLENTMSNSKNFCTDIELTSNHFGNSKSQLWTFWPNWSILMCWVTYFFQYLYNHEIQIKGSREKLFTNDWKVTRQKQALLWNLLECQEPCFLHFISQQRHPHCPSTIPIIPYHSNKKTSITIMYDIWIPGHNSH